MPFGLHLKRNPSEAEGTEENTSEPTPAENAEGTELTEKPLETEDDFSEKNNGEEEASTVPLTSRETDRRDLWETERKEKRLMLYRRDDVRRFVGWLLRANEQFIPAKSPATGEYAYSGTEFGLENVLPLLNELQSANILERKVIDTLPSCPVCQHSNFYVSFSCPFCQHSALEAGDLIEHYPCGYSDFENNFRSGTDLVCPKCHRFLKVVGTDYRKVTQAYRCMNCEKFFGTPKLQLPCRVCGRLNVEAEMLLTPAYSYVLNKALKSEVVSNVSLDAKITEFLKKSGYKVTMPLKLPGLSGVTHNFDLGAKNEKEKKTIALDMVSAIEEVGPRDVVEFFAKVYDTKPPLAILIAIPRISAEAQRLAAMYGVRAIAAEEPAEAVRRLMPLLEITPSPEDFQSTSTEPTIQSDEPYIKPETSGEDFVEQIKKGLEEKIPPETQTPTTPITPEEEMSPDETLRQAREEMRRLQAQIQIRDG